MKKHLLIGVLIVGLSFVGNAYAVTKTGHATEEDPYCEPAYNSSPDTPPQNGGPNQAQPAQPFIGYGRIPPGNTEVPVGANKIRASGCEGEQWDGQDYHAKNFANNPNDPNNPCSGQDINAIEARYNFALWQCYNPDNSPITDATKPVGVRVSAQGDNNKADRGYAYVMLRVFMVGRTGVFAEGCRGGSLGSSVIAPDSPCDDGTTGQPGAQWIGRGTLAWYGHDDTPLNVLATAISAARVTRGFPADGDCTQAHYQHQAQNDPVSCGRDNTAITIDLLS